MEFPLASLRWNIYPRWLDQNVQDLDVGQLELFLRCLNVKYARRLQNMFVFHNPVLSLARPNFLTGAIIETRGVFHLPKDSGKFRKLRWEMIIGEGRVPFDTLVLFIPRLPSPSDVFPAKIQNGGTTVVVERNARLLFGRRESR